MTMGYHQATATILPFPGRAQMPGKTGSRPADKVSDETKATRTTRPSFTDSWYHQAAIDEAPHTRKP